MAHELSEVGLLPFLTYDGRNSGRRVDNLGNPGCRGSSGPPTPHLRSGQQPRPRLALGKLHYGLVKSRMTASAGYRRYSGHAAFAAVDASTGRVLFDGVRCTAHIAAVHRSIRLGRVGRNRTPGLSRHGRQLERRAYTRWNLGPHYGIG